jgi:hypothetical protein
MDLQKIIPTGQTFGSVCRIIGLSLLILVLSYDLPQAQEDSKENIYGFMVGVSSSNISNYDGKSLTRLTAGLYWDWKFSKRLSLQSNFLYSQRGTLGTENTPDIRLAYLNLPIMLKYNPDSKFSIATGIYSDLLLMTSGDNVNKKDFKDGDFGIPITIGYDVTQHWQLGLSYNIGLQDITTNNTFADPLKNYWGTLTLTYVLR